MNSPVFLSGPMSGYPAWNFPAFYVAEAALKAQGYEVINPAKEFPADGLKDDFGNPVCGLPCETFLVPKRWYCWMAGKNPKELPWKFWSLSN